MTVKELKESLSNLDDDMEVMVVDGSTGYNAYDVQEVGRSVWNQCQIDMFPMIEEAIERDPDAKIVFVISANINHFW